MPRPTRDAVLIPLGSADDPRLAPYVSLRDASLRRTQGHVFIAEGELVIRRALAAGYEPVSYLLSPRMAESLADVLDDGIATYVGEASLVEELTGFHVHRGALAAFRRESRHDAAGLVAGARRLVVVESIVDHANLGGIVRSAAALGWDGLVLSHDSADPLYRRAIKASMGLVLSFPWARLERGVDLPSVLDGWTIAALALRSDAESLDAFAASLTATDRVAILLGTEGHGLSQEWIDAATRTVMVPMAAGVDSLNVAAAAAVACYALGPVRDVPAQG